VPNDVALRFVPLPLFRAHARIRNWRCGVTYHGGRTVSPQVPHRLLDARLDVRVSDWPQLYIRPLFAILYLCTVDAFADLRFARTPKLQKAH